MRDQLQAPSWFGRTQRKPQAAHRLFCFHHAGGSASIFGRWAAAMPEADVLAVQLPGREARMGEAPVEDLGQLVGPLADAMFPHLDRDYALFGHSMGTLVAFELVRELRRRRCPLPAHLFMSGRRAPHAHCGEALLHTMDDNTFLQELTLRYGGMPTAIAQDPEMLALYLPIIRSDMALLENYRFRDEAPLDIPMTVLGGLDDPGAPAEVLMRWQALTSHPLAMGQYPGAHFYLTQHADTFLPAFRAALAAVWNTGAEHVPGAAAKDTSAGQAPNTCR